MIVLGLDTATTTASIAIVQGTGAIVAEARHDTSGRKTDVLVAIDTLCKRIGIALAALDAVAIGAGPGSFTGLRIGMATAKGIAFAAHRPLWAVSSLAALAHEAKPSGGVVVAALDARRGELFAGCYRDGALLAPERTIAPGDLASWAEQLANGGSIASRDSFPASSAAEGRRGSIAYCGDALTAHPEVLAPLAGSWLATVLTPSAAAVAQLALAGPRSDVLLGGAPSYIRPSEAEVKYPDGVPGALRRR